jgi:multidrug efflux pump subunit AcrB
VLRDALPRIRALDLPPGYFLSIEGEEKERSKAFGQLTTVFFVIVGLLLAMLTMQFHSLKRASVFLASVPLAIIGAVLGLWLSGNTFSFMAFLGVVSLAGMVIKNAVVWVEFVDRELDSGLSIRDAVVQAGIWRFRPIC